MHDQRRRSRNREKTSFLIYCLRSQGPFRQLRGISRGMLLTLLCWHWRRFSDNVALTRRPLESNTTLNSRPRSSTWSWKPSDRPEKSRHVASFYYEILALPQQSNFQLPMRRSKSWLVRKDPHDRCHMAWTFMLILLGSGALTSRVGAPEVEDTITDFSWNSISFLSL